MSEPRRFLDRDCDDGPAALLLSSARDDAPSAQSFDRVALRLGVAGTVLGAAALTGGAATAATTAATGSTAGAGLAAGSLPTGATAGLGAGAGIAGASAGAAAGSGVGAGVAGAGATVAKVAGVSFFTKLVGVAAVGLAVTGGAAIARHELGSSPARPSVSIESTKGLVSATPNAPNAPNAKPTFDVPAPVIEGTTTSVEGPKAAPEAPEAPKPSPTSKPSSTAESPRETTLRDEVVLLDRARAEIARGATNEALATLAKHDATYPRGFLGSEAEVLRIEALVRAGRTPEATSRGEALLAREPNGPHAQRVRTLLGQ